MSTSDVFLTSWCKYYGLRQRTCHTATTATNVLTEVTSTREQTRKREEECLENLCFKYRLHRATLSCDTEVQAS